MNQAGTNNVWTQGNPKCITVRSSNSSGKSKARWGKARQGKRFPWKKSGCAEEAVLTQGVGVGGHFAFSETFMFGTSEGSRSCQGRSRGSADLGHGHGRQLKQLRGCQWWDRDRSPTDTLGWHASKSSGKEWVLPYRIKAGRWPYSLYFEHFQKLQ